MKCVLVPAGAERWGDGDGGDGEGGVGAPASTVRRDARPGVPAGAARRADPGAQWVSPEQQPDTTALAGSGSGAPRPCSGRPSPRAALSGALRRLAYRLPEHRATRWGLLLAADRVDVLEHRFGRGLWGLAALGALAAGYALASRALRR